MSLALDSYPLPRPASVLILDAAAADELPTPAGCRADRAACLAEAQELLRCRTYSLVLCSQSLPADVRHEVLAFLSQAYPDLPCLFIQGSASSGKARDFLGRSAQARERSRFRSDRVLTETLRALIGAMDSRDPSNRTHSQRVTRLAMVLGEAMGLPPEEMEMLELSALLHDVGKIAVPEQILAKPGPLDEDEWSVIRKHPEHSADIVRQVPSLSDVATVVRHHHERVDGRGYPDGLTAGEIPTLSQLISIVDAYEAMTADRCYRPAMETERARAIIREGLGTQFNSQLGEVFLSIENLP